MAIPCNERKEIQIAKQINYTHIPYSLQEISLTRRMG